MGEASMDSPRYASGSASRSRVKLVRSMDVLQWIVRSDLWLPLRVRDMMQRSVVGFAIVDIWRLISVEDVGSTLQIVLLITRVIGARAPT